MVYTSNVDSHYIAVERERYLLHVWADVTWR